MMTDDRKPKVEEREGNWFFLGLLLIGAGSLLLLGRFIQNTAIGTFVGTLVLPVIGAVFLVWAFYTGRFGLAIPGSILMGLGIGVILTQAVPSLSGGAVILGLALGFVGITVLAQLFGEKNIWWPLIPAVLVGGVGTLVTIGGDALRLLEWMNIGGPLIAIGLGLYFLYTQRNKHGHA
jgi:hypothetical protein